MKYAFYPRWYIIREEDKYRKRVKISLSLLLLLMLLVILQLSLEVKNLMDIEDILNKKLTLYNKEVDSEENKGNYGVEHSFYEICKFSGDNNLRISSMTLSEEAIYITFQLGEKTEYSNLVAVIEKNFEIRTISPPIEYNEIFLVDVEVEKDEDL